MAFLVDWLKTKTTYNTEKGEYVLGEKLGEGGMGAVYKASFTDKHDKKMDVALKKILYNDKTRGRALKEVETMRKLSRENISVNHIKLYDAFMIPNETMVCISMEYCDKGDLAERIESQRRSGKEFDKKIINQYMFDVANGINELHTKHRIVHRDIKPANILISYDRPADGRPQREILKISDYGICKMVDNLATAAGMTNTLIMTKLYAAPEQLAGLPCKESADIWAAGMIFLELCKCTSNFDALGAKIREVVAKGSELTIAGFPKADNDWLNKMLKYEEKKRITSQELYNIAKERQR